jgi:SPP1 family phage portal protein
LNFVEENTHVFGDIPVVEYKNNDEKIGDYENGQADWLTKNINDNHVENLLERVKKDIHKFSKPPALTDEHFSSNLSGVAIRFKLWGLEQDTVNKERKFKKGLQRRFELISSVIGILDGKSFDYRDIKISFTRNIPTNILE